MSRMLRAILATSLLAMVGLSAMAMAFLSGFELCCRTLSDSGLVVTTPDGTHVINKVYTQPILIGINEKVATTLFACSTHVLSVNEQAHARMLERVEDAGSLVNEFINDVAVKSAELCRVGMRSSRQLTSMASGFVFRAFTGARLQDAVDAYINALRRLSHDSPEPHATWRTTDVWDLVVVCAPPMIGMLLRRKFRNKPRRI